MVEYQSGSSDMIQSMNANVVVTTKTSKAGALRALIRLKKRRIAGAIVLVGHPQNAVAGEQPDRQSRAGSDDEARRVHVSGFVADGEMLGPIAGVGPLV